MDRKEITSNKDLKVFIPQKSTADKLAKRSLEELGYKVLLSQEEAQYLVLNDLCQSFDINDYREELRKALKDGQKIVLLSKKQLSYFCFRNPDGYDGNYSKSYLTALKFNILKEEDGLLSFEAEIGNPEEVESVLCPKVLSKALLNSVSTSSWKKLEDNDHPSLSSKKNLKYIYWKGLWY